MPRKRRWSATGCLLSGGLAATLLVAGCAKDLLFMTYTTLGVELTGQGNIPTSVRLAYKRFEGAVIPVDPKTGAEALSVLASIDAEQSLWTVRVNEVFATGEAAKTAATTESMYAAAGEPGPVAAAIEAVRGGEMP